MVVVTTLMPTHKKLSIDLLVLVSEAYRGEWLAWSFFFLCGRGQMVVVATLMLTHKIKDCLSARIFHSEGGSAKSTL